MLEHTILLSEELPTAALIGLAFLCLLSISILGMELKRADRHRLHIGVSGGLAIALLALAIIRPVQVTSHGSLVGARAVVLLDSSRRMKLPVEPGASVSRRQRAIEAVGGIREHFNQARVQVTSFGEGQLQPFSQQGHAVFTTESDLLGALSEIAAHSEEQPGAIVVVSDGR